MDPIKNIGQLLRGDAARDAVHIAVAPVRAAFVLRPGQRVGVIGGGKLAVPGSFHVGIVDPFLTEDVQPGEAFYIFLFPSTVTSLRHEWAHPEFPCGDQPAREPSQERKDSEAWLRSYAEQVNTYDQPEEAYQRLLNGLAEGELYFHGSDLHCRSDLYEEDELRRHAEIVLGKSIDFGRFQFSCSC